MKKSLRVLFSVAMVLALSVPAMADGYDEIIGVSKEALSTFQSNQREIRAAGEMAAIALSGKKTSAQIMGFQMGWRACTEALDQVISDTKKLIYASKPYGEKARDNHTDLILAHVVGVITLQLGMMETADEITGIKSDYSSDLMKLLRGIDKDLESTCRSQIASLKRDLKKPLK